MARGRFAVADRQPGLHAGRRWLAIGLCLVGRVRCHACQWRWPRPPLIPERSGTKSSLGSGSGLLRLFKNDPRRQIGRRGGDPHGVIDRAGSAGNRLDHQFHAAAAPENAWQPLGAGTQRPPDPGAWQGIPANPAEIGADRLCQGSATDLVARAEGIRHHCPRTYLAQANLHGMGKGARSRTAVTTSATIPMALRRQSICCRHSAVKKFISEAVARHPEDIGRDRGHPRTRRHGRLDGHPRPPGDLALRTRRMTRSPFTG